jgi:hypothetical protein
VNVFDFIVQCQLGKLPFLYLTKLNVCIAIWVCQSNEGHEYGLLRCETV